MTSDAIALSPSDVERAEEYRRQKMTAVLAIVFTDIAGSTELRELLGEIEYERIRVDHEAAVRDVVESNSLGRIVKSTGDGVLAVFAEPSASIEHLLRLQRSLNDHPQFRLRV